MENLQISNYQLMKSLVTVHWAGDSTVGVAAFGAASDVVEALEVAAADPGIIVDDGNELVPLAAYVAFELTGTP